MAAHPDLEEEQHYLDRAHQGLDAMRADANAMLDSVLDLGRGGTFQSRTERDIVVRTSLARLAHLDIGDQALLFGRIDRLADEPGAPPEAFHIGRVAVSGPDHEPLVVDWRAPVAEPFYRATGRSPEGLARRRHLAVRGRTVLGLEDEVFDAAALGLDEGPPAAAGPATGGDRLLSDGVTLGGAGALLAAMGQARSGRMGDIVATIQREQDEIIRAPLAGLLLVQGGPGTGKTAVALHRAAYLLYTHRFPLEVQGVLVVGPNPLFLRYIEQVLPSLGETGVTLSTVAGLVSDVKVRGTDSLALARLKGDARMATVLARGVRTRQRPLRRDATIPFGALVLRLPVAESERVVAAARRRPGAHNTRRRFVEQQVLGYLVDQYRARRGADDGDPAAGRAPALAPDPDDDGTAAPDELDPAELRRRLRRVPEVAEALDRMWPRLTPAEFLHDLFGARALVAAAARGVLSEDEIDRLVRPRSPSLDQVAFTVADVALLDEARTALGPRTARAGRARAAERERADRNREEFGYWPAHLPVSPVPASGAVPAGDDEPRAYGHIVVDEVQDLSPMQLRMLARRSISGSMTVVGDIAQATGPWAPRRWSDVTRHLSPKRPPTVAELTVSYRTPAEVVAVAARVLAVAAPELRPPTPVRATGIEPEVVRVDREDLAAEVAAVAGRAVASVAPGRTAVLAPAPLLGELAAAMARAGTPATDPRDAAGEGLASPLVLLPVHEANGLEFDAVVVVEPALVAAPADGDGPPEPTTSGLRTLYVALTRPTRRLSVVHSSPLPVDLVP